MSYGIKIYNSYGDIQIDETHKGFRKHEKIDVTKTYHEKEILLSYNSTDGDVIVGLKPWDYRLTIWSITDDEVGIYAPSHRNGDSVTINLCLFCNTNIQNITGYGINIYNASGDIIFTSSKKPMKILNMWTRTVDKGDEEVITPNDVNNYFVFGPPSWYEEEDMNSDINRIYHRGIWKDGGDIHIKHTQSQIIAYAGYWYDGIQEDFWMLEIEDPDA